MMMVSTSPFGPVGCGQPLRGPRRIHINHTRHTYPPEERGGGPQFPLVTSGSLSQEVYLMICHSGRHALGRVSSEVDPH
jgi:hypothetical protein